MWIVSILKGRNVSSFLFPTLPGKCKTMSGGAHTLEHLITGKRACACMQSVGRAVTVGVCLPSAPPPAEWRHHLHSPGCAEKQSTALPPLPARRVSGTCLPLGTRLLLVCARSLRGKAASWCLSNPYHITSRNVHTQSINQADETHSRK